jgi:hypothetical protein
VHLFRGYPDLRMNRSSTSSDTSLWPSFTDIMTVILMVFMLTMVVVIIKNADLIDQIRLSRQLQAEAEQRLASNVQVLADLRVRNTDRPRGIHPVVAHGDHPADRRSTKAGREPGHQGRRHRAARG